MRFHTCIASAAWWLAPLGLLLSLALPASPAAAQDRGDRDERSDRDDRDRDRERERDDDRGDRGRFDPNEMVKRLDRNGNGQLDPDEVSDRTRGFLEGFMRVRGLDYSKPIPITELTAKIQAARETSGGPGGPGGPFGGPPGGPSGGPPGGSGAPGGSSPGPTGGSSSSGSPAVPGFGEPASKETVQGFDGTPIATSKGGLGPKTVAERYDSGTTRDVDSMLRRYDRNRSGALEKEEWGEVRWSNDPNSSDLNRDGILSRDELLERIAGRRRGSTTTTTTSSTSSSSRTTSSSSSGEVDPRILRYAEGLLSQYDENKNGQLERDEWKRMRGDPEESDRNRDGIITKEELAARMSQQAGGRPAGGPSGGSSSGSSSSGSSRYSRGGETSTRKTERFLSPLERLPKGLPDWFARSDVDADGQVMMHEYSSAWSDSKVEEFLKIDLNGDGIITPFEALESKAK